MDIWSIEEFLNAGLLGPRSEFVEDFERPIREGGAAPAMAELKKALAPFLLRRLKNDPEIAAELGAKREIREYCVLSARQRAAYEVALARYANAPREERGGKGHALALLTELKLVCDGLGGNGEVYGGKVERLVELLESIFDAGESVLVFTQYVKVGERIKSLIEKKFSRKVPFLHGGLTPAARDAQIAAFNSSEAPTAFVLSLKAGGFGLNLTKATHVTSSHPAGRFLLPLIKSLIMTIILTTNSQSASFSALVRWRSTGFLSKPSMQLALVQARALANSSWS